jgi:hypothetical protein
MTGGAFAAKYLITSTKQISPSVLKKLKGAAGPAGAAGAQGAAGAAGAKGDAGAAGKEGPQGKEGLQGKEGPQGKAGKDGKEGSPWVVGTAPEGVLLKGTWAIQQYDAAASDELIPVPISTGVPVDSALTGLLTFYVTPGGPDPTGGACPGSAAEPKAELTEVFPSGGIVCLYASVATNLKGPTLGGGVNLSKSGGGVVPLLRPNEVPGPLVSGHGTWALITPIEEP